jgi:NADH:ubiquinone oxidoreductase subunit 2 (subunit N)
LFSAAYRAGENHGLLWLVAIALFGSFVSLYYYLIVLKVIFVDKASDSGAGHMSHVTRQFVAKATIALLAAAVLFLGIMPQTLATKIIASLP